jgi:hypothetical protein
MSVTLASTSIVLTGRPIPWSSPAKFMEIGRQGHLNGNLRDCIAAYRDLSPVHRGMAMILSDVLVPTCQGFPAVRKLEPRDMDCLLAAFHAEQRAGDAGETDRAEPAVSEAAAPPL